MNLTELWAALQERAWFALFGAIFFLMVYWWRRKTRGISLQLSSSSTKLAELVETGDRPDAEDVAGLVVKIGKGPLKD